MRTVKLVKGYEVDVEISDNGDMFPSAARKHGEPWEAGLSSFRYVTSGNVALRRIIELEDEIAALKTMAGVK